MSKGIQIIKENNNLAEWSRQVEECRTSGLSVRSWCEQHQIAVSLPLPPAKGMESATKGFSVR